MRYSTIIQARNCARMAEVKQQEEQYAERPGACWPARLKTCRCTWKLNLPGLANNMEGHNLWMCIYL